eukprot:3426569-Rhodomonas_salina.1
MRRHCPSRLPDEVLEKVEAEVELDDVFEAAEGTLLQTLIVDLVAAQLIVAKRALGNRADHVVTERNLAQVTELAQRPVIRQRGQQVCLEAQFSQRRQALVFTQLCQPHCCHVEHLKVRHFRAPDHVSPLRLQNEALLPVDVWHGQNISEHELNVVSRQVEELQRGGEPNIANIELLHAMPAQKEPLEARQRRERVHFDVEDHVFRKIQEAQFRKTAECLALDGFEHVVLQVKRAKVVQGREYVLSQLLQQVALQVEEICGWDICEGVVVNQHNARI